MNITYDQYSLLIDDQRIFIRSAAMHYFRLPDASLWRDRLYQIKAAGYNAVDLYFNWGFHSSEPGQYDFEGPRDVHKLLALVEEVGLYLIARPGPYINAEVSGGGLPHWLIADQSITLRNRKPDGDFHWDERYMDYVRDWYKTIVPIINQSPNLILMQIENEYATTDVEPDYIQDLYNTVRALGVKVPLFHNDLYAAGLYQDVVDIYAFDNYSVTSFDTDWRQLAGVFSVLDHVESNFRPFCENRPLFVAELQAGWFGQWKGLSYEHIIEHLGREHIAVTTKSLIGQGLTLFNHYKGVGGTNWDYIGSTDTYTSYDFAAPISEAGIPNERLYESKALNYFLQSFDLNATKRIHNEKFNISHEVNLYAVRQVVGKVNETWIFLRNLTSDTVNLTLDDGATDSGIGVHLNPHECLILPRHITLQSGATLISSSIEPVYQNPHMLIFKGNRDGKIILKTDNENAAILQGDADITHLDNGCVVITTPQVDGQEETIVTIGKQTLFILGQNHIDRLWLRKDGSLLIGADLAKPDDTFAVNVHSAMRQVLVIEPDGNYDYRTIAASSSAETALKPIAPKDWQGENLSPAVTQQLQFFQVSRQGADLDSNGFYEGSAWYRYHLGETRPKEIVVDARHIWAVFFNGTFLAQGHHMPTLHGEEISKPEQIPLPPELFKEGGNELVIFVDGLGHPKGFHDDTRTPQGLLQLLIDGLDVTLKTLICWGFSDYQKVEHAPPRCPVARFTTAFQLPDSPELIAPMGLDVSELPYDRVNIYLNDTLIGRHWKACGAQDFYYLPDGILQLGKPNKLSLIAMQFNPLIDLKNPVYAQPSVKVQPFGVFTKLAV